MSVRSVLQVAVVDADARRARGDGDACLLDVVHFDDGVRAAARRPREASVERVHVEDRDDEQHPVGTRNARLGDLHGIDREVLAQQGDIDCRPDSGEVVERAAEVGSVGQHGDGRGTGVRRSRCRESTRIELGRRMPPLGDRASSLR